MVFAGIGGLVGQVMWNLSYALNQMCIRDRCYVALADQEVAGFLLATRRKFPYLERGTEPDRGWINVLFVEAGHRRQGIGRALVEKAEADMKARGAKNITVAAYSPNYFFPGIDKQNYPESAAFFDAMGYQSGEESYSMCKDLHGYQLDEAALARKAKAEAAGFRFIPFSWKYCCLLYTSGPRRSE